MRWNSPIRKLYFVALCVVVCFGVAMADTPATKKATTSSPKSAAKSSSKKKHGALKAKKRTPKKRGQKAIDAERTEQIQEALIREHYLSGAPSGKWDAATEAALRRYQGEQGWQTKTVPDSRALIKLGLGPSHDHLLNPETAMTTAATSDAGRSPRPAATSPPAQESPSSDAIPQQ